MAIILQLQLLPALKKTFFIKKDPLTKNKALPFIFHMPPIYSSGTKWCPDTMQTRSYDDTYVRMLPLKENIPWYKYYQLIIQNFANQTHFFLVRLFPLP